MPVGIALLSCYISYPPRCNCTEQSKLKPKIVCVIEDWHHCLTYSLRPTNMDLTLLLALQSHWRHYMVLSEYLGLNHNSSSLDMQYHLVLCFRFESGIQSLGGSKDSVYRKLHHFPLALISPMDKCGPYFERCLCLEVGSAKFLTTNIEGWKFKGHEKKRQDIMNIIP
jgi:hypothetical protein